VRNWAANATLSAASVLVILVVLELATRIGDSEYRIINFLSEVRTVDDTSFHATAYDESLGWAPIKNFSSSDNIWSKQVTITAAGFRLNGDDASPIEASNFSGILVVGDSYTFGAEVGDHETWPAYLEKLTGIVVLNGGVSGYGIDQMYIRAKQLLATYSPKILILSFIPDDLRRVTVRRFKPYYELNGRELVLKNSPVPPLSETWPLDENVKNILGFSYLTQKVMMMPRFRASWVEFGGFTRRETNSPEDRLFISCVLINSLDQIATEKGISFYIVAQYRDIFGKSRNLYSRSNLSGRLLDCISTSKDHVIDFKNSLLLKQLMNPEEIWNFYQRHSNAVGEYHYDRCRKSIRGTRDLPSSD
jgi:hypothetical protein